MTATLDAMASIDSLLGKRDTCVKCDDSQTLVCPPCGAGEECVFTYPKDCTQCRSAQCLPAAASTPTSTPANSGGSTNVGALAGGPIAGVVALGLIGFLVWRYCVKTRRQPVAQEAWEEQAKSADSAEMGYAQAADGRSVRTRHSIASTVLTRASNIIQIAYIPGVTNRAAPTPTSPGVLVPPIPPIPIAVSQATSPAGTEDQHFFVPGDLRDSTYSSFSGYTDRTSYARTSYAPRSSVASTIYAKNSVIIAPAQTGMRAKPAMVSVKSSGQNSSGASTPPVPSVDYEKYASHASLAPPSPAASTFSVGSTFLNNASAHTAMPAKAQVVRVSSGRAKKSPLGKKAGTSAEPASPAAPETEKGRESATDTLIDDSPTPDQGPFSDPPLRPSHRSTTSLSAVIEEATRRASQRDSQIQVRGRERSPFGDENATQED